MQAVEMLDDNYIEAQFRAHLKRQGVSRSSLPKQLYRRMLAVYARGYRRAVLEQLDQSKWGIRQ